MTSHLERDHSGINSWLLGLVAVGFLLAGATCQSSDESENSSSNQATATSPEAPQNQQSDQSTEKAPPSDLYDGMNFSALDKDQRRLFVDVAKGELCPCEGANQSLHGCLQSPDTQCTAAKRVGSMIASGVRNGLEKDDLQSKIADFQKRLTETYEFSLENAPKRGPADAPVVIVEFADFQCPHCKRASKALKQVKNEFGDKVVHYFKHYPLKTHPQADLAARASIAAHRQGEFWPMHDLLFEHQRSLSRQKIMSFARQLGLNISEFQSALKAPSVVGLVKADKREAHDAKIQGTPAIFINGRRHVGRNTSEALSEAVKAALERAKQQKTEQKAESANTDAGN